MKSVKELLAIVEDICPNIKSSEKLFIVGLIIEEQTNAYIEGLDKSEEIRKEVQNEV